MVKYQFIVFEGLQMRPYHMLLTLLLTVIWGCNFVVVSVGLGDIPPLLFCTLRFLFASIPAVFFIKKPAVAWPYLILYGVVMFALQFGFMFEGIRLGAPPGLSSLLAQTQVFFTLILAGVLFHEKPTKIQITGALIAFSGVVLVIMTSGNHIPLLGLFFVLCSAVAWGVGNLITKKIGQVNRMSLVAWGCLIALVPMLVMSLATEGATQMITCIQTLSLTNGFAIAYIVYLSTWLGYGIWGFLLTQYPVATVVPFTLLVPVFGMLSSIIFLGEPMQSWKIAAATLIVLGLMINLLGPKWMLKRSQASTLSFTNGDASITQG